jgi:hypothetical protein
LRFFKGGRILDAFVKGHNDIGADGVLNGHRLTGSDKVLAAAPVVFKEDALVGYLAQFIKAERPGTRQSL